MGVERLDNLGVSLTALPLLRDLIHDRTGLFYGADRTDILADRVLPRVLDQGFTSVLDYFYLLKYDPKAESEWPVLMDALSVPETYFWREIDQLQAIVEHVVPELARRHSPLRIWSVPCATGEEPLTMAMLLEDAGWFDRVPIEIHASDASPAAIARAREGLYRERAFRSLPSWARERYFTPVGDHYRVAPALKNRIDSWSVVNLRSPEETRPYESSPIILCRNVFIYFSAAAARDVVERFAAAMPDPAYLCVAAAESLLTLTTRFELKTIGDAFIYVKRA
jgi:chemotaxis protein methyltransferase CheR